MSTRAGPLENTPVSNWLAELRMECYKKNLENFETIKTLLDIKEIELKKLGIMNSRDRATMMGSLANYRAVKEDRCRVVQDSSSKSLLRKGSLKKLNFKGLLGSSSAKKGKKKTESVLITAPAHSSFEQSQEVPLSPRTTDQIPDYEELPEFSPFETKHFKVVTRPVVENEYVPSPQNSPRLDTYRSRSRTVGEFDMTPEVTLHQDQFTEEESPNMLMKHKHSSVISMESGLSFGFDIDKDFNPSFPLENQPWYHGRIPRAEAESLLHENGDFLVRENVTMHDTYTLSMHWNGAYDHTLISTTEVVNNNNARGVAVKYHFDGGAFDSIPELINSHLRYLIPLDKDAQNVIMNPVCKMGANKVPTSGYAMYPPQDLSPTHYNCITLPKNFGSKHKKRSSSPDHLPKHTPLQPVKSVSISPRSSPGRDHVLRNSCSSSDILEESGHREVATPRNVISPTPQSEMRARARTESYGTHGRSRNVKGRLDSYGEDYEMMESVSILKTSPSLGRRNIPPAGNSSPGREPVQYAEIKYHSNHSSPASASKRTSGAVKYAEVRFRQQGSKPSPHPFSVYDTIPKASKVTTQYQSRAEVLAQKLQLESNYATPTPRPSLSRLESSPHPFSHYATVQTFPRQSSSPSVVAQRASYVPSTQTNTTYTLPHRPPKEPRESITIKNRQSTASNSNGSGHSSPGLSHSSKVLKGLPGYEALVDLHSLLGNYTNEDLAFHLTKADAVCFLLTPRAGEDLSVWRERVQKVTSSSGLYYGLQTLADPDGEKIWKRLYFRHLSISQLVSLCIVSAGDITERAKVLRRFIEIATLLQSGSFGNLFSFVAVMQGIAAPQITGMAEVWDILEHHFPYAARSYKERQNIISNLCDGVSMFATDQLSVPAIQHLKTVFHYEEQNICGFAPPVEDRSLIGEYSSLLVGLDGIHTIVANCSRFSYNAWKRLSTHKYDATLMDFFMQDYTRTYLQHMGVNADNALERRRRFGVLLNALLDRVEALESL